MTKAVHLSKNNAGVLRPDQRGQKPLVEQKGKSWLDLDVHHRDCENTAYRSLWLEEFTARGLKEVTTGITVLRQPSVHSDVAF